VIGTVIIFILREYLKSYLEYSELVYGLLLILVVMAAPDGIMGLVHKLRNRLRPRNADPDGQRAQTPSGTVQP
jgi:branched-chain amino acid transport system permease protein